MQTFYLIDEAEEVGKGANTVTSLVHHYFLHWGYGENDVILQMDNCVGQNKNNTVIRLESFILGFLLTFNLFN